MPNISLDLLDDHPDNANCMKDEILHKLINHIRISKNYPPLILRPHPQTIGRYQILDGHHRAKALRELGYKKAACEIWDVDDTQTDILLLTLNRLCGDDDPYHRGAILKRLSQSLDISTLAKKLKDDSKRIKKLIDAAAPPPKPLAPRKVSDMPHGVVFFLTAVQKNRLYGKLKPLAEDKSDALVAILDLNHDLQDNS